MIANADTSVSDIGINMVVKLALTRGQPEGFCLGIVYYKDCIWFHKKNTVINDQVCLGINKYKTA